MKRRTFIGGLSTTLSVGLGPKSAKALTHHEVSQPPSGVDYVVVQRGVSQAVIQVVKPLASNFTFRLSGGGTPYPTVDTNWDYWINGAQQPWNGDDVGGTIPVSTQNDVISRKIINVTNGQWHMVWEATPADAAGELVTIIEVGALGDSYTPKTLADVQALCPQLFV